MSELNVSVHLTILTVLSSEKGISCSVNYVNLFSETSAISFQKQIIFLCGCNLSPLTGILDFCSLLPLRHMLLCCLSEWVSECNNRIQPTMNSADFDPIFPDLRDFPWDGVFFRVFSKKDVA